MTGRQVDMAPISNEINGSAADVQSAVQPNADLDVRFPQLAASGPEMNALKTGQYSRRLQENAAPWREAQITAIRADLGDDIPTLKSHAVEQLGTVLVILQFLGGNLMAEGPLTGKGRQRAATTAYLQVLDRFMRLAQTVGIERVAKQLPNPADWLEGKA
jgi:hypothetical protein